MPIDRFVQWRTVHAFNSTLTKRPVSLDIAVSVFLSFYDLAKVRDRLLELSILIEVHESNFRMPANRTFMDYIFDRTIIDSNSWGIDDLQIRGVAYKRDDMQIYETIGAF